MTVAEELKQPLLISTKLLSNGLLFLMLDPTSRRISNIDVANVLITKKFGLWLVRSSLMDMETKFEGI